LRISDFRGKGRTVIAAASVALASAARAVDATPIPITSAASVAGLIGSVPFRRGAYHTFSPAATFQCTRAMADVAPMGRVEV